MAQRKAPEEPTDAMAPVSAVLTVDYPKPRIRLRRGIFCRLSWLRDHQESLTVRALPGPAGGLRIWPPAILKRMEEATAVLANRDSESLRDDERALDYLRFHAAGFDMTFSFEPSVPRFTLAIPEDAWKLGLLPKGGGCIVVCALADLLELWPADDWRSHIRELARHRSDLYQRTLDVLDLKDDDLDR